MHIWTYGPCVCFKSVCKTAIKHLKKIQNTAQKIHQGDRSCFYICFPPFFFSHYRWYIILWCRTSQKYISSLLRKDTNILLLIQKTKCCTDQLRTPSIWYQHWGSKRPSLSFKGTKVALLQLSLVGTALVCCLSHVMEDIQLLRIISMFHLYHTAITTPMVWSCSTSWNWEGGGSCTSEFCQAVFCGLGCWWSPNYFE